MDSESLTKTLEFLHARTECRLETRQVPKERCETVPRESCSDVTDTVCEPGEPVCRVEVAQVPRRACRTVVVPECSPVRREECRELAFSIPIGAIY